MSDNRFKYMYLLGSVFLFVFAGMLATVLVLQRQLGGGLILAVMGWFGGNFYLHHCLLLDHRAGRNQRKADDEQPPEPPTE